MEEVRGSIPLSSTPNLCGSRGSFRVTVGFRCVATETCLFWLLVCYVISYLSEHADGVWFGSRESVKIG